ncbi:archaetidylserine decarboxylase [Catenovulum maritimum]|uniref:Phosphatidylserine decarboxylase proenzyme n=1 Tax=Catenovulum maritimum TaxID=1513271 RepID=A0A0J8GS00_9ALTE|nr:archaetidylserine decarboxylase [Catenovulum maritimum]KMT64069.1 phosphatidylserine decarboxylase [Catenovulum maritimum]
MLLEKFKIALQYCTPQHGLSRLVGFLAASKAPWISQTFIRIFANAFNISLDDYQADKFSEFKSFNDFFTRALKQEARPIDSTENAIVSPVDGEVSQAMPITGDSVFQAKGHDYSLTTLLGGDAENAKPYQDGLFSTIYLSPSDYHRLHMPCDGVLKKMIYVPGKLFSVNQATTRNVPGLFARNERLVCFFDTEFGEMAMVLVGAMIVASIETVWAGNITPPRSKRSFTWHYKTDENSPERIVIKKGEEMGRFKLGSTVVCVFENNQVEFVESHVAGTKVRLGELMGTRCQ